MHTQFKQRSGCQSGGTAGFPGFSAGHRDLLMVWGAGWDAARGEFVRDGVAFPLSKDLRQHVGGWFGAAENLASFTVKRAGGTPCLLTWTPR